MADRALILAFELPGGPGPYEGAVLQDSGDLVELLAGAGAGSAEGSERPLCEFHGLAHDFYGGGLTGMPRCYGSFHFVAVIGDGLMQFAIGLPGDCEAKAAGGLLTEGFADHSDDNCCGLGRIIAVNRLLKNDCCDSSEAMAESAVAICDCRLVCNCVI